MEAGPPRRPPGAKAGARPEPRTRGRRDAPALLFLHGGPGSGKAAKHRRYADPDLSRADLERLLHTWSADPDGDEGRLALDTILFHGPRARALAWQAGFGALAPDRARFLARELERDHARLALRLVDDAGAVRLHLPPTRVPLGEKQHIVVHDAGGLQPPEVSGTVKRVGLSHLWVRL